MGTDSGDLQFRFMGPVVIVARPQLYFDDLYTAAYALIDDAEPHPVVLDYGKFFAAYRCGLFGYVCRTVNPGSGRHRIADLDEFDRSAAPRVLTRYVFELLARAGRRASEPPDAYLSYLATRRHRLGAYRGGSSGFDDESRAFAAAYFRRLELVVQPNEVLIFCGGFKGALICVCAAVMSLRRYDELRHSGGLVLCPVGYYQSLRLIRAIFGGVIEVVSELDGDTVTAWLAKTSRQAGRIIYVPLVNNADGRVRSKGRACSIAYAVLDHNRRHPANPVWVVADEVYAGSYLSADLSPQSIAALVGADLGAPDLGVMSDCTVTITTPSKTVALPTVRVAFVTTTSAVMRSALTHYRTVFSFGRVPQIGELSGVAALCLTPQTWIDGWNAEYRRRFGVLTAALDGINEEVGCEVYQAGRPEGGWYFTLRVARRLFPADVTSGVHASAVFLNYGQDRTESGVAMLPGELFGHGLGIPEQWLILRSSLAVDCHDLRTCVERLGEVAHLMRGPYRFGAVQHALTSAHAIVDLDRILAQRRY